MSEISVRWAGTRALLVELATLDDVLAYHGALQADPLPGQIDALAAARTVLVKYDSRRNARRAREQMCKMSPGSVEAAQGKTVEIEVVYDGDDIESVAERTGLGVAGVIEAHTGQAWRGAFGGFAPGFTYLVGDNNSLEVPRRETPRTAVPAGSVALAGNFSAIYPGQSPGGWQLIGRTNTRLWDVARDAPALVRPGDTVRFVAVDALSDLTEDSTVPTDAADERDDADSALEIITPGIQSLIQDLGRPGLGDLGVSAAGAADTAAARQANRLVGNAPDDALIETVMGGLRLRARGDQVVALTGAQTVATIAARDSQRNPRLRAPFRLNDGETLQIDAPTAGLRSYLAARGGIDVAPVLASRSRDSMSGIGPEPLAEGRVLAVAEAGNARIVGAPEASTLRPLIASTGHHDDSSDKPRGNGPAADTAMLRVTLGPRDDWFDAHALARLCRQRWITTEQSNRIGVRLSLASDDDDDESRPLERSRDGELASEGVVAGALQVPPSGLPVLFLADHPVTGGYPVIAVVLPEDLSVAAQLAPGTGVRFVAVDADTLEPIDHGDADAGADNDAALDLARQLAARSRQGALE